MPKKVTSTELRRLLGMQVSTARAAGAHCGIDNISPSISLSRRSCVIIFLVFLISLLLASVPSLAEGTWYPSKYGANDTIGAANNLNPEIVRKAAGLVTAGKVYSLAINTGPQTPKVAHRNYQVIVVPRTASGKAMSENQVTGFDDLVIAWQGVGTQIDGLGHYGINFVHYNGLLADDIFQIDGLKKLDVHAIPPIVTRGVLLNMAAYYRVDIVDQSKVFNRTELEAAAAQQHVEIRKGDVVLLHTGWLNLLYSDTKKFFSAEPGIGVEGAQYLADLGVVAVGADSQAVEVVPAVSKEEHAPVHQVLLVKNGVYLLEYIDTRKLAADGVSEFLFVLGQPRLVGAVQAIINPIAIR